MRQLILGLIFIATGAYSQTNKFQIKSFPADKFKVTYDTTDMSKFRIVLVVARPVVDSVVQYQGTKVWVQLLYRGKLTEKYLGELETERGIYRPSKQPIEDTYIIVESFEYEGLVHLITSEDFVTIPGHYYALNKPGLIYTRDAHLDDLVYMYDLKNKKGTNLTGRKVVVDNLFFEEVEGAYWVK